MPEKRGEVVNRSLGEVAGASGEPRGSSGTEDRHAPNADAAEERQAVAVDETQAPRDRDGALAEVVERGAYDGELLLQPLDQTRPVSAVNHEVLGSGTEQAASALGTHAAAEMLGVDHRHTSWADSQMIDVRA
jgi:hypothetical protein